MNTSRARRLTGLLAMSATTLACLFLTGEGSVAGIQGSGFRYRATVYGNVTQFGSIYVNGTEYDTSAATIRIDGQPASESQLRVGQVVTVTADTNGDGTEGAATDVSFSSDVLGPVAQVNLSGGTLVVLGQTIHLLDTTLIDENLQLAGILTLLPGVRVQVSGFPNAAGELQATRIGLALGGSASARVKGIVQALNTTTHTFRINAQTVKYGSVVPVGTLANGSTVAVQGSVPFGQTALQATGVQVISGVGGTPDDLGDIEGLITVFTDTSSFMMGAQRVVTDASTQFILNGQTLGPNAAVHVQGVFDAAGTLVASRVEVATCGAGGLGLPGLLGVVESVSASDGSLRVLGVPITISPATALEDASNQNARPFGLSELRAGDYVEVRGGSAQPGGAIQADVVRRTDAQTSVYIEGAAHQLALPGFTVLGVSVLTTPQTHFPGGGLLAPLQFFLQASSRTVRVRGAMSGNVLIAEQVQFVN